MTFHLFAITFQPTIFPPTQIIVLFYNSDFAVSVSLDSKTDDCRRIYLFIYLLLHFQA